MPWLCLRPKILYIAVPWSAPQGSDHTCCYRKLSILWCLPSYFACLSTFSGHKFTTESFCANPGYCSSPCTSREPTAGVSLRVQPGHFIGRSHPAAHVKPQLIGQLPVCDMRGQSLLVCDMRAKLVSFFIFVAMGLSWCVQGCGVRCSMYRVAHFGVNFTFDTTGVMSDVKWTCICTPLAW